MWLVLCPVDAEGHVCHHQQRHEEPKEATDEHEKGTYVYFDYNIMHDDSQVLEPVQYNPGLATCLSVTHVLLLRVWSAMLSLTSFQACGTARFGHTIGFMDVQSSHPTAHICMQSGWCYRLKQHFTFRYDALEDES
jgi:hypothetical protein